MKGPHVRNVLGGMVVLLMALAVALAASPRAQQAEKDTPKVNLVSVVGCATRGAGNAWLLTNASEAKVTAVAFTTEKDREAARTSPLGKNRYRLIGTAEFGPAEELLRDPVRSQVTAKGSENATSALANGRKVLVKGLLIKAPDEQRLNLTSVQPLADNCK